MGKRQWMAQYRLHVHPPRTQRNRPVRPPALFGNSRCLVPRVVHHAKLRSPPACLSAHDGVARVRAAIVNAALTGKREASIEMMNTQCRPLLAALIKATNAYSDYTHQRAHEMEREAAEHCAFQRALLIGICLVTVLGAIAAAFFITRSLTRALGAEPDALSAVTRRVASGDLSPVPGGHAAPRGSIFASMADMQTSLCN